MAVTLAGHVAGVYLRPGMRISKFETESEEYLETVGPLTGNCGHGLHFGNACYDYLGYWYVWETMPDPNPSRTTAGNGRQAKTWISSHHILQESK